MVNLLDDRHGSHADGRKSPRCGRESAGIWQGLRARLESPVHATLDVRRLRARSGGSRAAAIGPTDVTVAESVPIARPAGAEPRAGPLEGRVAGPALAGHVRCREEPDEPGERNPGSARR